MLNIIFIPLFKTSWVFIEKLYKTLIDDLEQLHKKILEMFVIYHYGFKTDIKNRCSQ